MSYSDPFNDPSGGRGPPRTTSNDPYRQPRTVQFNSPSPSPGPNLASPAGAIPRPPQTVNGYAPMPLHPHGGGGTGDVGLGISGNGNGNGRSNYPYMGQAGGGADGFVPGSVEQFDDGMDAYPRGDYGDSEEMKPLTGNGVGGYDQYPPGAFGNPSRPLSSVTQTSTEAGFIHRQTAMPKRGGTKKRVKLTGDGHWVNEYPVPRPVLAATEPMWRDSCKTTEFTHMRYTAATCDPDDFTTANGWSLRTSNYGRETELLIAVTSYNEDKILYARTLHALMLNIRDICRTKASKFWRHQAESGAPPWQRITVALIADGLGPMNVGVLDLLATVGVYQDGVLKKEIDGKKTTAHIFEYTTQISVDATPALVQPYPGDPKNLVPVQIIFCLKQENGKKINSHRWLFNAFGKMLNPEICVLIDAGTRPGHKAIYYLWEAFYNNKNLGGACGEITAMLEKGKKLINPLVAAQNFEYKMSNILDKPLESFFGYVTVLPGAFSAYRYQAILGRPLETYFLGDHTMAAKLGSRGVAGMGIFKQNSYLAEDRLLCFELVAKANKKYTLAYVKPSKAETDVPETAAELISQRRRWLNGSFAASVYSLFNFFRLYHSSHGPIRMLMLHIQGLYNLVTLIFTWFSLASIWLTFSIIINLLPDPPTSIILFVNGEITHWVNLAFQWVYLAVLGLQIVLGLGNRPKAEKFLYVMSFVLFGIIALYTIVCSVILSVKAFEGVFDGKKAVGSEFLSLFNASNGVLVAAICSTFGYYFLASLLYRDPWHMFHSFPAYMLTIMSFTNVINIYAFCNMHDVSWGTKGSDKAEALPTVTISKIEGGRKIVDDFQKDQDEVDDAFQAVVKRAVAPYKPPSSKEAPSIDDQNRTFRTRLLAIWLITNGILAISIESLNGYDNTTNEVKACFPDNSFTSGNITSVNGTCVADAVQQDASQLHEKQGWFFRVLLLSFFSLTSIKFIGCVAFWTERQVGRLWRKN